MMSFRRKHLYGSIGRNLKQHVTWVQFHQHLKLEFAHVRAVRA